MNATSFANPAGATGVSLQTSTGSRVLNHHRQSFTKKRQKYEKTFKNFRSLHSGCRNASRSPGFRLGRPEQISQPSTTTYGKEDS
jgi:hypothetical protein